MSRSWILFSIWAFIFLFSACKEETDLDEVWLDELPLSLMEYGKRKIKIRTPIFTPNGLSIADSTFKRSGTVFPASVLFMELNKQAVSFEANVGLSDKRRDDAAFTFYIIADQKIIWQSKAIQYGQKAEYVKVNLRGVKQLGLLVLDDNNNRSWNQGSWADARFLMKKDHRPLTIDWEQEQEILTPPPPAEPKINTPLVFGLRPNNPLLFSIAATGERPMTFEAENLPNGISLEPQTGQLSGKVSQKGSYLINLIAKNNKGSDQRTLRLEVGSKLSLTPPLGWNAWNGWSTKIDEAKVRASARAMIDKGLAQHGYSYINIDDDWQGLRGGKHNAIQPNEKFPDMKGLIDTIHHLGLKAGIYSTPWIITYASRLGGSSDVPDGGWVFPKDFKKKYKSYRRVGEYRFDQQDVNQWVDWGIDFLKYDWTIDIPPTIRMNETLENCGRDIVFTVSNTAKLPLAEELVKHTNAWRTSGDIKDKWQSIYDIGFAQDPWHPYSGPSHWNDPDMLVVGEVACALDSIHTCRLSPDEQYTHISLWTLLAAPMLIGCPLERLDDFTLNLLTNDEVIAINQDTLGKQARQIFKKDGQQIWAKPLADQSWAVGLFYTGQYGKTPSEYFTWKGMAPQEVQLNWKDLSLLGKYRIRDVWRQKDLGIFDQSFKSEVPFHGVRLLKISKVEE